MKTKTVKTVSGAIVLCFALLPAACMSQGTLTFTFNSQPPGTRSSYGIYDESGMRFSVIAPGSIFLNGGGIPGYPDNGTGYLETPDAGPTFGGVRFSFPSNQRFDLMSFDAAEYGAVGVQTLTVVGYVSHIMSPIVTVTNVFTLDGINDGTGPLQDFQPFNLDSSFQSLIAVEIQNARFSLDNVLISGVPEPSTFSFLALSSIGLFARHRKRNHAARK